MERILIAPYCTMVIWYCFGDRTPFHSYGLVTGTFPEHSWNPQKNNGCAFLKTNKEDFERYGLEAGPATIGRQITLDGLHNITG